MKLDPVKVQECLAKYPLDKDFRAEYGTAGFRAEASLLPGVLFRCGLLTGLRVLVTGKTCGLVVTASHNPVQDNGVKIVDYNGEMLDAKWEEHATALAKATTLEEIEAFCRHVQDLEGFTPLKRTSEVVVGYDNRPTSLGLAEAAKAGIGIMGVNVVKDSGPQTTPQVHFRVWRRYRGLSYGEFDWYKYLAGGYMRMARGTAGRHLGAPLRVDCANGIGADKLLYLVKCPGAKPQGYYFEVENNGESGELNHLCGADYVQKEKKFPTGFENIDEGQRCASLDGDADRAVFFTKKDGKLMLLDGDKMAALAAIHIKSLLDSNPDYADEFTVGVVQTAYANGASTQFLRNTLQVPVAFTKTGVKWLHQEAKKYDIGIYFEANGHGTVLVKDEIVSRFRKMSDIEKGAFELLALSETMNQAAGDGVSALLMVEAILRQKQWNVFEWSKIYDDLPNVTTTVKVPDRSVFTTTNADRECVTPEGLQSKIDTLVGKYKQGRSFVRSSGTEDVVRVYAEADTQANAQKLADGVKKAVLQCVESTH